MSGISAVIARFFDRLRVSVLVLAGVIIFDRAGLLPRVVDGFSPVGDAVSYHGETSAAGTAAAGGSAGTGMLPVPLLAMATLVWFLAILYLRKTRGPVRGR